MPFRFPLATVLRVREITEKREERMLQKIQAEIAQVLLQVEELTAAIVRVHDTRERAMQAPIPAGQLHSLLWEADAIIDRKKSLVRHLELLEQKRKEQVAIYQAAHRAREMLTDMLKRQRDAYDQESARRQQRQLDDLFIARHHRS
jgi:flagellar export protein FliJ